MKKTMWLGVLMAVMLAAGLPSMARAADDVVAPYISKQTDAVIHVDMTKLDVDQLGTWYHKAVDDSQIDAGKKAQLQKEADDNLAKMKEWVGKFTKAGGKDLYIVLQLGGIMSGEPGGMLVPLGQGADADALAKLINPQGNPPPADPNDDPNTAAHAKMAPATAVIGQMLVFAPSTMLEKFKAAKGEDRPDLTAALGTGGDAPVHVAMIPGAMKKLPMLQMAGPAAALGGPEFQNVDWIGLALALPPKGSGTVTMQAKDADSATALATAINDRLAKMKDDPGSKAKLGDNAPALADKLKPTVDGTKVTMNVDQATLDMLMPAMLKDAADKQQHRPRHPNPDAPPGDGPGQGQGGDPTTPPNNPDNMK